MVTTVGTVAVGDQDTAARQNDIKNAITELQTELGFATYRQSVTGSKTLVNTASGGGWTWPTASGYTSSGVGLIVPSTGSYVVTLMLYYSPFYNWAGRCLADLYTTLTRSTANQFGRGTAQMNVSEQVVCITGVTPPLTGGSGIIMPMGYQNSGATITFDTITCTIAPIPNLV